MGISSFSSFEGSDLFAFVVCGGIGYFVGTLAPDGAPSIYASILVAYHLFLAWLIFGKTANYEQGDRQAGLSLPLRHTLLTHTACVVVILAPVSIALHSMASLAASHPNVSNPFDPTAANLAEEKTEHTLRLIKGVCCSMAGLAVFERRWLFNSESPQKPKPEPLPSPASTLRATGNDSAEWHTYLAANRQSFPPGASIKAEYEKWLLARRNDQPPKPTAG